MTCKRMTDNRGYSDGILTDKFLKINNVSISLQEKQWIFFFASDKNLAFELKK